MKYNTIISILTAVLVLTACSEIPGSHTPDSPEAPADTARIVFAKGADISWVTQMEKDGQKFYNAEGKETECTALMKEIGFDAIRLRVWVDPEEGWCGKEDVLEKARRAQALGMRLMIDFHYSDSWADPGKQDPPAAWKDYDLIQMANAVTAHTTEVIKLLKDNDIDIEWVQIGNEVNSGMLWPFGKVQDKTAGNFISYVNTGCNIVKDFYPDAKVILHLSNGHDAALFDWFFNLMKLGNAKYDMIGMSLYPCWWENGGWNDWKPNVDKCIANMKALNRKFGKPVMLCETGMPVSEPEIAEAAIRYILDEAVKTDVCHGVFYWEPQTDGVWKPSSYKDLGWNAYDMGAFSKGRATAALNPFRNQ